MFPPGEGGIIIYRDGDIVYHGGIIQDLMFGLACCCLPITEIPVNRGNGIGSG